MGEIENMKNRKGITRIEVIYKSKRVFNKWKWKVEESIQDDGKTLKLFVEDLK